MTDSELENEFILRPEKCFRDVYDRYSGPLFRFLYRFTINNQVSEEILQDIFLELLKNSFKSQENGTLKSWLFTVAKNRGLNYQKKNLRNTQSNHQELESDFDLEDMTLKKDLLKHLTNAENDLPLEIKQTWNLRKSGLDNQAIATELSIPLGTVKSRFSRLVEYLRKEFEHES